MLNYLKQKLSGFKKSMFVVRYRWWIIISTLIIVLGSIIPLTQIEINSDLESYLPNSMQSRQNNKLISDVFGNDEMVLIVLESGDILNTNTLKRIENLSMQFEQMTEFKRVYSLFQTKNIEYVDGSMVVRPVVVQIPETPQEKELLRSEIKNNDLAYKVVVSADFQYALIMLSSTKTTEDAELMHLITQTLDKYPGSEQVSITGQPFLRDEANRKISRDLMVLLPLGLLIMLMFLWYSFRELKAVLLPFSVVVFSIVVCMALIPLFGWELSLIGVLIPIMMLAISNNYGVYFVSRYQDLNAERPQISMKQIVQDSYRYLRSPIVLCGLTTIVGILGLVAHLLLPARQMGIVTGIGIAFALLASLLFVPAAMSLMKKGKPHKNLVNKSGGLFFGILNRTSSWVTQLPRKVIWVFCLFFIACTAGMMFFSVTPDSNSVMPANHSFNKAIKIVDQHFGGSKMINIMFEGDAKDPALLNEMEHYGATLKEMSNVGSVTSLSTLVKKMSTALNDADDVRYNKIPESRDAVAQYIELYSMSGDPEDIEQFVDFDYAHTILSVQYQASSIKEINEIKDKIEKLNEQSKFHPVMGGYSMVDKEMSESLVTGQVYSLLFAFVAIFLLMSIIFKSIPAGFIGSLPLVFAVFCTFGLMGWLGIELNMVTALLSSISIGLGVDFTIQVFWRIKWELALGNSYAESVMTTIKTIGRGIIINAFAVMIGFSVLFLSNFPLVQSFGLLIILSLFLCLICALVFIPAICIVTEPKFLKPRDVM